MHSCLTALGLLAALALVLAIGALLDGRRRSARHNAAATPADGWVTRATSPSQQHPPAGQKDHQQ